MLLQVSSADTAMSYTYDGPQARSFAAINNFCKNGHGIDIRDEKQRCPYRYIDY
jgi:hypothetical protein